MGRLENKYQEYLVKKLQKIYPEAIILKNDPNYKQGIPDLTIFNGPNWATLEVKKDAKSSHQPNQDYYVERMNNMSYSNFIYPENEDETLDALAPVLKNKRHTTIITKEDSLNEVAETLRTNRQACIPKS